jgi:hypothetical protein
VKAAKIMLKTTFWFINTPEKTQITYTMKNSLDLFPWFCYGGGLSFFSLGGAESTGNCYWGVCVFFDAHVRFQEACDHLFIKGNIFSTDGTYTKYLLDTLGSKPVLLVCRHKPLQLGGPGSVTADLTKRTLARTHDMCWFPILQHFLAPQWVKGCHFDKPLIASILT